MSDLVRLSLDDDLRERDVLGEDLCLSDLGVVEVSSMMDSEENEVFGLGSGWMSEEEFGLVGDEVGFKEKLIELVVLEYTG